MDTVKYSSTGLVYGDCWGGGSGAYAARKLKADSKEELLAKANELLKSGGLDSGMGYKRLKGAMLDIKIETTKVIDGKEFVNTEHEVEFIGDLTEDEQIFLEQVYY